MPSGARVLELACGTGTTASKLARRVREIVAADISENMLAIARDKAREASVRNVFFVVGALCDATLPAWDEPFGVVMSFNFFHLVHELPVLLGRIRQLVGPAGLFISKTPCIGEYSVFLRAALPLMRWVGKAPYVNPVRSSA